MLHTLAVGGAAQLVPMAHGAGQAGDASPVPTGWDGLARHYDLSADIVNLENAYYGIMARPVMDEFKRNIEYLNRHNSVYMRRDFDRPGGEAIRALLAQHAGVQTSELAVTRGATESLQNLIGNYRPLKAGDAVMYGNLDYGSMQYAMDALAQQRGASVVKVTIPEPATAQRVIDTYEGALRSHPRTRLLLLTHVSHRTGLVIPVREIVRMARQRNVDVIVDIAQSWGQLASGFPTWKPTSSAPTCTSGSALRWAPAFSTSGSRACRTSASTWGIAIIRPTTSARACCRARSTRPPS